MCRTMFTHTHIDSLHIGLQLFMSSSHHCCFVVFVHFSLPAVLHSRRNRRSWHEHCRNEWACLDSPLTCLLWPINICISLIYNTRVRLFCYLSLLSWKVVITQAQTMKEQEKLQIWKRQRAPALRSSYNSSCASLHPPEGCQHMPRGKDGLLADWQVTPDITGILMKY